MRLWLLIALCLGAATMNADEARVEQILSQMTLKEKIDYIGGHNSFYIRAISRLHIPEIKLSDGTVGVRGHGQSTSYPAGINIAASFNEELAHSVGKMMGYDARARGVHILLAPGINLNRFPLCGRNFEYFGEDPYLTSRMAVEFIKGVQSQNVAACVKHFLANNQEWNRHQVSSDIDEQTMHELYLPAFKAAVQEAKVACVMASYNKVNGIQMSQNRAMLKDLLKDDWGFEGIVISDWTSTYDGIEAANSGLDLEMPYAAYMNRETLFHAIQEDKVPMAVIDDKVRRILRTLNSFGFLDRPQTDYRDSLFNHKGHQISRKMAEESIVLLKNEAILPINKEKCTSIALIGPLALTPIPYGSGSSETDPYLKQSFVGAISDALDQEIAIHYASGIPSYTSPSVKANLAGTELGFSAEYYDNTNFSGEPAVKRLDQNITFQWKERSYRQGGPRNHYSIRWTGYFTPEEPKEHTFYISCAGVHKLSLNDIVLIDEKSANFSHKTVSLTEQKPYKICIEYIVGHGPQGIHFGIAQGPNRAIELAKEAASSSEVAIIFAGFGSQFEGEDWDRSFTLPLAQDALIKEVASVNPNTIVVLCSGGNVDMSHWIDDIKGLLFAGYPGQEGGKALADILTGKISPSGKLPVSFEKRLEDNACFHFYHDKDNTKKVCYSEGLFLGYRHHDKNKISPRFCFGHGLSYTTFSYSNIAVSRQPDSQIRVSFDIQNSGKVAAKEVAQVYVHAQDTGLERPVKELKGFTKVLLQPGETKRCTLLLPASAFSYYDTSAKTWSALPGSYEILVGSSSKDIHLKATCQK